MTTAANGLTPQNLPEKYKVVLHDIDNNGSYSGGETYGLNTNGLNEIVLAWRALTNGGSRHGELSNAFKTYDLDKTGFDLQTVKVTSSPSPPALPAPKADGVARGRLTVAAIKVNIDQQRLEQAWQKDQKLKESKRWSPDGTPGPQLLAEISANVARIEKLVLKAIEAGATVIVLPEFFPTAVAARPFCHEIAMPLIPWDDPQRILPSR